MSFASSSRSLLPTWIRTAGWKSPPFDAIAVLPRREPSSGPLTGIDPKTRALDVLVIDDPLAVAGRDVVAARVVRNFDDFPEELVRQRGVIEQEISEYRAAEGPADEKRPHRVSHCREPLSPKLRKTLDTSETGL